MKRLLLILFLILNFSYSGFSQIADFKADTTKGCVPFQVAFSDLSTGNPVAWDWDMGDGSSHIYIKNPTFVYNTPGIYSVKLIVTYSDATTQTKTITNYITASSGPYVNFSSDIAAICQHGSITFYDTIIPGGANVKSLLWDFGDGGTSTQSNPVYTFHTAGLYKVSLTAYNQMGCATKTEKSAFITIYPKPKADFYANDSVFCVHNLSDTKTATFNNNSTGYNSSFWKFHDGSTTTVSSPSKVYGIGNHDVTLIVTSNKGCKDTLLKSMYISVNQFNASFTVSDTIVCDTTTEVTFIGNNAFQYFWRFGDGFSDLGAKVKHTYKISGKFTVTLYATSSLGCYDTVVKKNYIKVYDSISASIQIIETPHCDTDAVFIFKNVTNYPSNDNFGFESAFWFPEDDTITRLSGDSVTYIYGRYGFGPFGSLPLKAYITTPYGCKLDVVLDTVYLFPMSVGIFMNEFPGGCAPLTVTLYGGYTSSSPIVKYEWIWGNGDTTYTDTLNTVYTYIDTGIYNPKVIVTNRQGCTVEYNMFSIGVGYKPVCNWTSTPTKDCGSDYYMPVHPYDSLDGSGNLVGAARANSWFWFRDGNDITRLVDKGITITYGDTGIFNYATLVCYHNFCPSDSVTKAVQGYVCPPLAKLNLPVDSSLFKISSYPFCKKLPILRPDINNSVGANLYRWNFGNDFDSTAMGGSDFKGDTSTLKNPSYHYKNGPYLKEKDGAVLLTLIVANNNTTIYNACGYCEDTVVTLIKISVADMKIVATDRDSTLIKEICQDETAYFWDSSQCTSSLMCWGMRIIDSALYKQAILNHTKIENSFIFDTVIVKHNPYYDSTNVEREAVRKRVPYYFPNYGVYYICLYNIDTLSCGGVKKNMDNDSINSTYDTLDHRIDTLRFVVNPRSVPDFTVPSPVCAYDTVIFNDLSYTPSPFQYLKINKYYWASGGKTDTLNYPKFVYSNGGDYDIALSIVNEKGCDSSVLFPDKITVYKIGANFSKSSTEICNNEKVSFRNISMTTPAISSLVYYWDYNGQGSSTSRNGYFTFNVDSSQWAYITLRVTDTVIGCTSIKRDSVFVRRLKAGFSAPELQAPCPELQCYFNDSSLGKNIIAWDWNFGDTLSETNTSALQNPSHSYQYAGKYNVTLVISDDLNCSDTLTKLQYVQVDGPYGTFEIDTLSGCTPLTVHFNCHIVNADTLMVITGDGNVITATNGKDSVFTFTYLTPDRYIPSMRLIKWVTDPASGQLIPCIQNFWNYDTVWAIRVNADFMTDTLYCPGHPIVFLNITDSSHGNIFPGILPLDSVYWDFGNGKTDSLHFDGYTQYDTAGNYWVTLKTTVKKCSAVKTKPVKIFDFPDITLFTSNASACDSIAILFTADSLSGKEVSFVWNFRDGNLYNGNPIYRTYISTGIYPYQLTVSFLDSSCKKVYYDTVHVNAWVPPDADFSILNTKGEDVTDRLDKGIKAIDPATFKDISQVNGGQIVSWIWNFGDNTKDTLFLSGNTQHNYTTTSGIVTVSLIIIDEYGCNDTVAHQLMLLETLCFPNIFSPNNDGKNDRFIPLEIYGFFDDFEMVIYNKWGGEVWKRKCKGANCPNYNDENFWWDGTNSVGQNVSEGVYYWVVSAMPKSKVTNFILNGSVTIVR